MQAGSISHLQYLVKPENLDFYKEVMTSLGWSLWFEMPGGFAVQDPDRTTIIFGAGTNDAPYDRDGRGVNHLALAADSIASVDEMVAWLAARDMPALFDTPRHRPEIPVGEENTYYQVMFETPDNFLLEVVYIGPYSG